MSASTLPAQGQPVILNLGCGTRTSALTTDIDWSLTLRLRRTAAGRALGRAVLRGERLRLFQNMQTDVVVHDLRKGIPAADGSVDAVYHSHVIEHIDRDYIPGFFAEIHRVLKPGGVHRIVCPDLERHARELLADLDAGNADHDKFVAALFEQSVRKEAHGTSLQAPLRRKIENLLLGDARNRGETHQWMWDRLNLEQALLLAGFANVTVVDEHTSSIASWTSTGLDLNEAGEAYKPGSLFVEAVRAS